MLAYGLRRRLQSALLAGDMPALAVDVRRVLEELDVQVSWVARLFHCSSPEKTLRCFLFVIARKSVKQISECCLELPQITQDDATLPAAARTRGKFRRCFGLEPPANALRLRGPLRVPPLR